MSTRKIVIIEDENQISLILESFFIKNEFEVKTFSDGEKALNFIESGQEKVDCFIVDRMLPNKNGIQLCDGIRKSSVYKSTPVLMLTALSSPDQIVEGLDAGADDYLTKPFDLNVLYARIRNLLKRYNLESSQNEFLNHENIKVNFVQHKVWVHNEAIDLTLSEYKILECLLKYPGKVFTRNQIVEYIQEGPIHVTDRTIDTHVFGLRKKLKDEAKSIETIRGIGYRLSKHD